MCARVSLALALSLRAAAALDLDLAQPTVSSGGGRCEDDWHCSLGGECTAGQCVCDHWTTGPQCNLLNLAHLERDVSSYGLQMPAYHSCERARTDHPLQLQLPASAALSQSGCCAPTECRGRPCGGRRDRAVERFLLVHVQSPHARLVDHRLLNRPRHRKIDRWTLHRPADGRAALGAQRLPVTGAEDEGVAAVPHRHSGRPGGWLVALRRPQRLHARAQARAPRPDLQGGAHGQSRHPILQISARSMGTAVRRPVQRKRRRQHYFQVRARVCVRVRAALSALPLASSRTTENSSSWRTGRAGRRSSRGIQRRSSSRTAQLCSISARSPAQPAGTTALPGALPASTSLVRRSPSLHSHAAVQT